MPENPAINSRNTWIVAQLGARMHYAVPRMLHAAGMLEHFYTDFATTSGWPRLLHWIPAALQPAPVRRMLGRSPKGVPAEKVTAFTTFGLEYARRLRGSQSASDCNEIFLWAGRAFCNLVLARGLGNAGGVYTFNSAGLELLQRARSEGRRAVMEQTIAPKRVEDQLLGLERRKFPDWETDPGSDAQSPEYMEREEAEWRAADCILCGSEFVRDGIAQCGGPAEKCIVVPYGVDVAVQKSEGRSQKSEVGSRPLRVLTVGAVGLRKGSPYVLEAAKRLKGRAEFRMVGHIGVSNEAQTLLREHLELTGPVPRSEMAEQFQWADVFLLPSICEGSATVTYEALAHGLPMICTPNTGSVVREGVEGFIIPAHDVDAIVDRLETLRAKPELCATLAAAARVRAAEFTVAAYGRRLLAALTPGILSQTFGLRPPASVL